MPPRNGASSSSTVRSPSRAAVTAAATPAEPPPATTRSASSATGSSSSGTRTRAATILLSLGNDGLGAQPLGDRGDGLEQHVEPGAHRADRLGDRGVVRGQRAIEVGLLAGGDPVRLREAGVDGFGEGLEPLLGLLAEPAGDDLGPQDRKS